MHLIQYFDDNGARAVLRLLHDVLQGREGGGAGEARGTLVRQRAAGRRLRHS